MLRTVETLSPQECWRRLRDHEVGRVSVSVRALPVIIPVLYRVDGDALLFGAPLDPTLPALCNGAVIAFEIDEFSAASDLLWSVMVVGVATLLNDQELRLPIARGTSRLGLVGRLIDMRLERMTGYEARPASAYPRPA